MGRGWKILIGVVAALAILLTINTFLVDGETKSAEVTVPGGRILHLPGGEMQVWAQFPADNECFGRLDQQAMVNYRVPDLEAMLEQLRDAGVAVEGPMANKNGRFGWGVDPEGNRFELWQPVAGQ